MSLHICRPISKVRMILGDINMAIGFLELDQCIKPDLPLREFLSRWYVYPRPWWFIRSCVTFPTCCISRQCLCHLMSTGRLWCRRPWASLMMGLLLRTQTKISRPVWCRSSGRRAGCGALLSCSGHRGCCGAPCWSTEPAEVPCLIIVQSHNQRWPGLNSWSNEQITSILGKLLKYLVLAFFATLGQLI